MLQSLRIRNLALLDEVSLDFEPGFTSVTGETGAGKSILLGALSLLAGERADKTIIRQGAAACEVEAALYFSDARKIDVLLAELDLPPCEDGALLLKRSLPRDKAPKLTVNGGLATLAALQSLGEHWIDFHGPSEPRRLLKESCQLELLDLFGRAGSALTMYQERYRAWRELVAERERVAGETKLAPDQIEFLQNQLAKIDALELTDEAIETLERDFQRMSRAQELIELAQTLAAGLTGDDGLQGRLAGLLREGRRLENLDPASASLAGRLNSAAIELNELGAEFSALGEQLQFDPEHAEQLAGRMNTWLELKRKYGGDVHVVLSARAEMHRRLEVQGDLAGTLARLEKQISEAERAAKKEAQNLRVIREKAGKELAKVAAKRHRPARLQEGGLPDPARAAGRTRAGRRLQLRILVFTQCRRGAAAARPHRLERRARARHARAQDRAGRPRRRAGAGVRRGGRQRRRRDRRRGRGKDGGDRPRSPGAVRDAPATSGGAGGESSRGHEGPVGRPRGRAHQADP